MISSNRNTLCESEKKAHSEEISALMSVQNELSTAIHTTRSLIPQINTLNAQIQEEYRRPRNCPEARRWLSRSHWSCPTWVHIVGLNTIASLPELARAQHWLGGLLDSSRISLVHNILWRWLFCWLWTFLRASWNQRKWRPARSMKSRIGSERQFSISRLAHNDWQCSEWISHHCIITVLMSWAPIGAMRSKIHIGEWGFK